MSPAFGQGPRLPLTLPRPAGDRRAAPGGDDAPLSHRNSMSTKASFFAAARYASAAPPRGLRRRHPPRRERPDRRMDRVSRQDLIARKPVLVQEQDGSPGSGEERRERCTGAPSANNDDVITGLCGHGHAPAARVFNSCDARSCRMPKVLRRVGAPRPPALGHGEQFAGCRPLAFESVNARNRPMSPAGNASGSRSSRIAMCCAVHSPMPKCTPRHTFRQGSSGAKDVWIRNNGRRERRQRRGAHPRHPERRQVRRRHVQDEERHGSAPPCSGRCLPAPRRSASRASLQGRLRRPDLLTEHGPNGELEPVPRTWYPQTWSRRHQRGEDGILAELR